MLPGGVYNACWGDVQKLFLSGLGRAGVPALILRSWMQTFSATPRVQISALLLTEMLGVLLRVRRPLNYPPSLACEWSRANFDVGSAIAR